MTTTITGTVVISLTIPQLIEFGFFLFAFGLASGLAICHYGQLTLIALETWRRDWK